MNRTEKTTAIAELNTAFQEHELVVITHYRGLTVQQMTNLRQQARANGVEYQVAKNRLARIATRDTQFGDMSALLKGPTGLAWSKDPVAAAKVMADFAKENPNLAIVGGSLGGKVLSEADVRALAALPSLDVLRSMLLGVLNAPASKLASIAQAPAAQLARVFNAYATKEA